jgi:hypothetical protein
MFLKWTFGRQNSGYSRLTLCQFNMGRVKLDSHIIKFPTGSNIPEHVDSVDGYEYHRLNIVLKNAKSGGIFYSENTSFSIANRIFLFRPDKYKHAVSKITSGTRIVFSFGLALKKT